MSKHTIYIDGLKLTFPDDETYDLYLSGEAYFDEGWSLRMCDSQRLCKRVKVEAQDNNYEDDTTDGSRIKDAAEFIADLSIICVFIYKAGKFAAPKIKKAAPKVKQYFSSKKDKSDSLGASKTQANAETKLLEKEQMKKSRKSCVVDPNEAMCRAVTNYLGLLDALNDLKDYDPEQASLLIEKLTDEESIDRVNAFLNANPMFLEENRNIFLLNLGRDLVQNGDYVPIQLSEIQEKVLEISGTSDNS